MATKTNLPSKGTDRAAKLANLRDKLKNTDFGGSSGFLSIKEGVTTIRILPPVGDMEFFFQQVGRHHLPPDGKKQCYCPKFTSEGELECPICDMQEQLWKAGDKELAAELRERRMWWMNVIDRKNEKAGPQIYTPGVKVYQQLASLILDPEYGEIYDVDEGIDIKIERVGTGQTDTTYTVHPQRKSSPLSEDPDLAEEWLNNAKDLSYVQVSEDPEEDKELSDGHAVFVLPYARIEAEFGLEDVDEPEPAKPARGRKVEEDDDEEDEAPRGKMARRSTRR